MTDEPARRNIARMQRDILRKILERVSGLTRDADSYRSQDGHELTLYLGEPGRAMVVSHVQSITVLDTHLEIQARDRGTLYAQTDSIHAIQSAGAETKGNKRAGVGFTE